MKKNGREFILEFRVMSMANPRGKEFLNLIENNNIDNENIVIYSDAGNAIWAALDSANDQNSIGMCTKISDCKENTYTGDEIKNFVESGDYKIVFDKSIAKNVFAVKIIEEVEEIENKNITTVTLEEVIERIVSEKICTKKEVNERIKVMRANRVDEKIIIKTLASYRKYDREIKKPSTVFIDPDPKSEESIMQSALISAGTKRPTIFNGLHSSGKNVCAETLAWLLNKPYFLVGISAHSDTEELFGAKSTEVPELNSLPEKELIKLAKASEDIKAYNNELIRHQIMMEMYENAGKTTSDIYLNAKKKAEELEKKIDKAKTQAAKYDMLKAKAASVAIKTELSEFVDWLQTGGVLMLNEINMAEPNFLQKFINPIGDGTGFITTSNGRIDIHEDCWLLGSMNENYTGSMPQNMATGTRFKHIIFPAPVSIKKQLISPINKYLKKEYFEACEKCYKKFKSYIESSNMVSQQCLNIRGFKEALDEVAYSEETTTLKSKIIECVINGCPEEERQIFITHLEDTVHI